MRETGDGPRPNHDKHETGTRADGDAGGMSARPRILTDRQAENPYGDHGYRSQLHNPFRGIPGLQLAIRICGPDLARAFKRVPPEYVGQATRLPDRTPIAYVACPCGQPIEVNGTLTNCPGCTRWYITDHTSAWAARLPENDDA